MPRTYRSILAVVLLAAGVFAFWMRYPLPGVVLLAMGLVLLQQR